MSDMSLFMWLSLAPVLCPHLLPVTGSPHLLPSLALWGLYPHITFISLPPLNLLLPPSAPPAFLHPSQALWEVLMAVDELTESRVGVYKMDGRTEGWMT